MSKKTALKLQLHGKDAVNTNIDKIQLLDDSVIEPVEHIQLGSANRSENNLHTIECENPDDIVNLEMSDGMEWIGSAQDFKEIFGSEQASRSVSSNGAFQIPSRIQGEATHRGAEDILINFFKRYIIKPQASAAAEKLGVGLDKKIMPDNEAGVYFVSPEFELIRPNKTKKLQAGHYLLFIHGTISSTAGSFSKIIERDESNVWQTICNKYGDNIICAEHKTVSKSPVENTVDILKALPDNCTLDIISHSRGGIVADLLARCDQRNELVGFNKEEMTLMGKEDKKSAAWFETLNKIAAKKKIKVHKTIRVACPARGTILLSTRLDHFLNGLLNAVGKLVGGKANLIYLYLKTFLMEVIKSRATAKDLPGLNAMVPKSTFQKILNNPDVKVSSQLIAIEGTSKLGGTIAHSILVIFANLYYWKGNDFVVNTDSMRYGAHRIPEALPTKLFLSSSNETNHFNYFKNQNTKNAIRNAIEWDLDGTDALKLFHAPNEVQSDRGAVTAWVSGREERIKEVSGTRPIVVLLPGTMGSNLEVEGDKIWLDFPNISKGKLVTSLNGKAEATSILGKYYSSIVRTLTKNGYDVRVFPFDWRSSLTTSGDDLAKLLKALLKHKQPVKLLAHSMGGLVVRELMLRKKHQSLWKEYINQDDSVFIMMGTPWQGSYSTMQVLTGNGSTVGKLSFIDFKHSSEELINVFHKFEGVYQLLPVNDEKFETAGFWRKIKNKLSSNRIFTLPPGEMLKKFGSYKKDLEKFFKEETSYENIFYIAGKKRTTADNYFIKDNIFGRSLQFLGTADGDGTVSYKLGIPPNFPEEQTFYTNTEHMLLANDPDLFEGILELLKKKESSIFSNKAPLTDNARSAVQEIGSWNEIDENGDNYDQIFGVSAFKEEQRTQGTEIKISIVHANLKFSDYPVMVGHFKNDGILSAEKALNKALDYKLEERLFLGNYANEMGEQVVITALDKKPKGALVVGLGDQPKLTGYRLMKTVEKGILEYACHLRDNVTSKTKNEISNGISTLAIGSGFGNLPLESSIHAIINGVHRANIKIREMNKGLREITNIEFVDLYEHIARNIFYALHRISKQESKFNIRVSSEIEPRFGNKKRIQFNQEQDWWHQFQTEKENIDGKTFLKFLSSSGIARSESIEHFITENNISELLEEMADHGKWNPRMSKLLFELLIPNDFKQFIRYQNNISWKMDKFTAAIPWEMFHDSEFDHQPAFVNAGFIRQLATDKYEKNPAMVRNKFALVIGDPIYKDLSQLPAAKREAEWVDDFLNEHNYQLVDPPLVRRNKLTNLDALASERFKILHIAAHGLYDIENDKIGIAIGGEHILTSNELKSLLNNKVPEFVFINCCYSGTMDAGFENYYQNRYGFAANVGTELIQMGVTAAIVTGWPVDDGAAEEFAQTFYKRMVEGYYFGEAVKLARKACYSKHRGTNTWGAYQCYGNPWYKFNQRNSPGSEEESIATADEVLCELDNLIQDAKNIEDNDPEWLMAKAKKIIKQAVKNNLYENNAKIIEREADLYSELNELDIALDRYEKLLNFNKKANFTVRSFEQYCNLLTKKIARDHDWDRVGDLSNRVAAMLAIGETSERWSIYASAHKRIATLKINDDDKKIAVKLKAKKASLEKMYLFYKTAFIKIKDQDAREYTYPLINYLQASYFLGKKEKFDFKGKKCEPYDFLTNVAKELLKNKPANQDFWKEIAPVNIYMCQILFAPKNKEKTLLRKAITKYTEVYKDQGSLRKLQSEIDANKIILDFDKCFDIKLKSWSRKAYQDFVDKLEKLKRLS